MAYILETVLADISGRIQQHYNLEQTPQFEPARAEFKADFALPCFTFAKQLKNSPVKIAENIASHFRHEAISRLEAVNGFVNITLNDATLLAGINEVQSQGATYGAQIPYAKKTQVIETNNPNPFKDIHIGHAYNSIVADTLANLLELGGGQVHRVSYHGDVGLHVGKNMWAILQYASGDIHKLLEIVPAERPAFLSKMYVQGAGAYEEDPIAKQQIEALAKQSFTLDDPYFKQVYELCKQWSFDYLDETIATIGSKAVEKRYLERQTDAVGRAIVENAMDEVFTKSNGAIIFPGEAYGLHTRVFISSRDTTLYEARDLGLMQLKNQDFKPDTSYIVTAEEQRDYFAVVLKAAALALPQLAGKTKNIAHGTVKLSTGKMSSRTGKVLNIEWIFTALRDSILRRSPDALAIEDTITGALRYAMLKVKIGSDLIFDIHDAVSLEGNSGPYLQYAYARGRSILAKVPATPIKKIEHIDEAERLLVVKLLAYANVTAKATADLAPHLICTYLYELTQQFNRFYEHNRIVGHEREAERAYIVECYTTILRNGLTVLGIPAPERL